MKALLLAMIPTFAMAQPFGWYQARPVSPVSFQNSGRLDSLMRAGQLYLSLPDAIALALENNLDIELQRTLPRIAGTDVQRASGGGQLRGLSLLINQPPPGIGGPNGNPARFSPADRTGWFRIIRTETSACCKDSRLERRSA